MCLDIPARVIECHADRVSVVTESGRRVNAATLLVPDVRVGDWVRLLGNIVTERLDPVDAEQIRNMTTTTIGEVL